MKHLLENGHTFRKMTDVMEVMHFNRKGTYMDTMVMKGKQFNDQHMISHNKIFEVLLNKECQLTSLQASTPLGNQCSTLQLAVIPNIRHTLSIDL